MLLPRWLFSAGPTTTKVKGELALDEADIAVRGMMVTHGGESKWPWTPPPPPPPPPRKEAAAEVVKSAEDYKAEYLASAKKLGYGMGTMLGIGLISPNLAFSNMFTTFALSGVIGYQVVWGVTPALHSPLMAVTNAISGMTAVGGMYAMGGGLLPSTTGQVLGAVATGISAVNITGGFLVTKKMLDLFKRPEDPPEFYELYQIPSAAFIGGLALTSALGFEQTAPFAASVSALGCIGGIAGLATQKTARLGNVSGMTGVAVGMSSAICGLGWEPLQYVQLAAVLGVGGGTGYAIAKRVDPTSLPQTVAAFHSLVGLAASFTAIGDYLGHEALHGIGSFDGVHMGSIALATVIGGVTATGSVVAFGKLNENLNSAPFSLPARDQVNMAAGAAMVGCMAMLMANVSHDANVAALCGMTVLSGGLGLHMTSSIGGADMPVVITVLNSCAPPGSNPICSTRTGFELPSSPIFGHAIPVSTLLRQVLGLGPLRRRFHARQTAAHHRRRSYWLVGRNSHAHYVRRDES